MKNTFPVPHRIIESKKYIALSPCAKVLLINLYKLTNRFKKDNGWFFRSINKLSQDTGMNRRTISKVKQELSEAGLIEIFNSNPAHADISKFRCANQQDIKCMGTAQNTQLRVLPKIHK